MGQGRCRQLWRPLHPPLRCGDPLARCGATPPPSCLPALPLVLARLPAAQCCERAAVVAAAPATATGLVRALCRLAPGPHLLRLPSVRKAR